MSEGHYFQDFNSLATSGTANAWVDNVTLPGWYASKTAGGSTVTVYRGESGSNNAGALYSFGVAGVSSLTDRALGTIASGTPGNWAYGVRFTNDTGLLLTNFTVSYTGEQWRNGNNVNAHTLAFSYRVSANAITNADAANTATWIAVSALNFVTPTTGDSASALDGNSPTNRQFISAMLAGVAVEAGEEIFIRWRDVDDPGNDHGMGIDDLLVTFESADFTPVAPEIVTQPESQIAAAGDTVQFSVSATGNPAPNYQWQYNATNLPGATQATLNLLNVTTNHSGAYRVVVSNSAGAVTSAVALLSVYEAAPGVSVLTYNVRGNGATDWSTNAAQVQAIARQLQYLQPDIVTFNEVPWEHRFQMTNFVKAFLPDYQIVISSGTDGSICSAIASRFPITRASKWLDGIDLRSFGYSNANNSLDNFSRDLYEAQIAVPGFSRPLHVFTTHLKATSSSADYADNAAKRAAEAAAITNFFATNLFVQFPYDLYVLTGDMNASDTNELCIQKLLSPATGLQMTQPRNPVTGGLNTYSTATANPASRLDYIFPGPLLASNIKTGLVFRSNVLTPLPPGLNSNDSQVASDHYPVLTVFNNPYDKPFKLLSVERTNATVTLRWESVFGQTYRVESSSNLLHWSTLANQLVATGTNVSYSGELNEAVRFFRVYRVP